MRIEVVALVEIVDEPGMRRLPSRALAGQRAGGRAVHREKPGQVELHEKTTDILFVVDGEALYVTGGKMIGGKQTRPGEWLGTDIEGGVEHHLKKGDVIVVPAGTPHYTRAADGEVIYQENGYGPSPTNLVTE